MCSSDLDRMLVVDEDYRGFGVTSEVIATVAETMGRAAPLMSRLAPDVPVPASLVLEQETVPSAASITAAVRTMMREDAR